MVQQAAGAANQYESLLEGDAQGVRVQFDGQQYLVGFDYNPVLVNEIRGVAGAAYSKDAGAWTVPGAQRDALAKIIPKMRDEVVQDGLDLQNINNVAHEAALQKMRETGREAGAPKISDYHVLGKAVAGEIISVNGRYAAQLTGFGKEDGAAFVTVHRVSELSDQVFKGDKVTITYGEKGKGQVQYRQSQEEKLDESLGKYVDGVKVIKDNDRYKIAFDYNPVLTHRIQRIDGAQFNREERVWEVAGDKKEFIARAVNDMRKEVTADRTDRAQIEAVATEKIDGAKVKDAFTKDGTTYSGKVLAANERYVLQHSGKEYVTVHRAAALAEKPEIGRNARVTYKDGRGHIADRSQSQSEGRER